LRVLKVKIDENKTSHDDPSKIYENQTSMFTFLPKTIKMHTVQIATPNKYFMLLKD